MWELASFPYCWCCGLMVVDPPSLLSIQPYAFQRLWLPYTGCWSCLITCIVVSWLFIAVQIDDPWHNSFMSFYWEREKIGEKLLLILLLFLPSLRSLSNVSVMCGVRSGFVNESLQGKIGFHVWHLCVLSFQVMLKEGPRALYKGWDSYLGLHEHCVFNQVHVYLRCMVLHNLLGTLVRCNNSHC